MCLSLHVASTHACSRALLTCSSRKLFLCQDEWIQWPQTIIHSQNKWKQKQSYFLPTEQLKEVAMATTKDKKENMMSRSLWWCPITIGPFPPIIKYFCCVWCEWHTISFAGLEFSISSCNGETTSRVGIRHCREPSMWCTCGSFFYFKMCMQECQMAEPVNIICINSRDFLLKKKWWVFKKKKKSHIKHFNGLFV